MEAFGANFTKLTTLSQESSYSALLTVNVSKDNYTNLHSQLDKTLDDLNDEEVMRRLPSLIYLTILILIGLPGNISVLVIFSKFYKKSTYRVFVLALAAVDTVSCAVCMPFEIIETRYQYKFYLVTVCKIFRTNNVFIAISSIFILISLSIDRYRHVCQPLKSQFTAKTSRYAIATSFLLAVFLAWPNLLISGIRRVDLKFNLTGIDCSLSDKYSHTQYPFYYTAVQFLVFIISIITLIVLYILIGRKIFKHSKFRRAILATSSMSSSSTKSSQMSSGSKTVQHSTREHPIELAQASQKPGSNIKIKDKATSRKYTKSSNPNSEANDERISKKITKVAFAISVLFILSYLPYLILTTMTAIKGSFVAKPTPIVSAILPIVTRLTFVNSVGNPFIYGFIDLRFRFHLKSIFCRRRTT